MGLDTGSLGEYLQHQTGSSWVDIHASPLSGGAIQENHALEVEITGGPWRGAHHWVLRTDAPSGVQVSRSREQEFRLLEAAFHAGLTVPEPLWLCTDTAVIGRPFYLMTRVPGTADGRTLTRRDWTPKQRRAIVTALAGELARIHAINPEESGLSFLRKPDGAPALSRIAQYRGYLDQLRDPQPILEWGLRWLELNAPDKEETVLCHCDFRTGNIMIDGDRITGILDWEFSDYSNPVEDLGWFCARCWRFGADRFEAGGIGEKEDFVKAYEEASGRKVDRKELDYWQTMAEVRWGVIALQQTDRHLSGRESSLELALTGYMVPEMESNLVQAIARACDV